jgi:2-iminobutanoate/2-iminopropanoate deaminase
MNRFRESVSAPGAPAAIGPYSHAVRAGELLFCSGQIPLDPVSGEVVGATAAEQARRCLENLQAVCAAAGTTLAQAVRVTVYMTDLERFGEVNKVYGEFFTADPPARVTVGVAALPRGALVEIDAVVALASGAPGGAQPSEVSSGQPVSPQSPGQPVSPEWPALPASPTPLFVPEGVYHVELRHFPRNACRFNLSAEELRTTVLEPWVADRPFELGELRWDPRQARLLVLEGPRIPPDQLSMGRGWRIAQHEGRDVTAQLLGAAAGPRRA